MNGMFDRTVPTGRKASRINFQPLDCDMIGYRGLGIIYAFNQPESFPNFTIL